ncbi:uncharacterized protein RAG0_08255 [Rhynchosporium agropyri]|uniref:DUF6606 domain-containing protein n=1 Tax=Rhynchosporium agropyri TaxID=914238 RepID=A0A1E1KQ27_9HELO|nr:uncharacterized protein RAG0_08255 [Rhynchosporium agropyri]
MYPSSYSLTQPLHLLPEKGGIAIHIGAQNAGLLISRVADQMHVKAFELFPDNESVIGTKGRAVSVPSSTFSDDAFQTTISQTLAKMTASRDPQYHQTRPCHGTLDELVPSMRRACCRVHDLEENARRGLVERCAALLATFSDVVARTRLAAVDLLTVVRGFFGEPV